MQDTSDSDTTRPVGYEQWRALVEKGARGTKVAELQSVLPGGLAIAPLYAADAQRTRVLPTGARAAISARCADFRRPAGFLTQPLCRQASPEHVSVALQRELGGGAGALWLRFCRGNRLGQADSAVADGIEVDEGSSFSRCLSGVDLSRVPIAWDAGANAVAVAALLCFEAKRRGLSVSKLRGWLCCDPLGGLAADGQIAASLEDCYASMALAAKWSARVAPGVRVGMVATHAYHDAGALPARELALAISTGVTYLRQLDVRGIDVPVAAGQLFFSLSVGRDYFVELAKLRSLRVLWARILGACGVSATDSPCWLHAKTAWRTLSQAAPWTNLLRSCCQSTAAILGGADALTTEAHDALEGASEPTASAALARNISLIAAHESHLGFSRDPAAGSWYLDTLTEDLCREAWQLFQQLEEQGGVQRLLIDGSLASWLDADVVAIRDHLATGAMPMVGQQRAARTTPTVAPGAMPQPAAIESQEPEKTTLQSLARCLSASDSGVVEAAAAAVNDGASYGELLGTLRLGGQPTRAQALRRWRDEEALPRSEQSAS